MFDGLTRIAPFGMMINSLTMFGYALLVFCLYMEWVKPDLFGGSAKSVPPFWTCGLCFSNVMLGWCWWPSSRHISVQGLRNNFLQAFSFFLFWDAFLLPEQNEWFTGTWRIIFMVANGILSLVSLLFACSLASPDIKVMKGSSSNRNLLNRFGFIWYQPAPGHPTQVTCPEVVQLLVIVVMLGYCVMCFCMGEQWLEAKHFGGTKDYAQTPQFYMYALSWGNFMFAWALVPHRMHLTHAGFRFNFLRIFVFFTFWDACLLPMSAHIGWFGGAWLYCFYVCNGVWALLALICYFVSGRDDDEGQWTHCEYDDAYLEDSLE